jgi:hypothetical protein
LGDEQILPGAEGWVQFRLSAPLNLVKGDRVKLTLEAVDFRGEAPGESYLSDPLVLEISDEAGVLAARFGSPGRVDSGRVLEGPVEAEDYLWWRVRLEGSDDEGWVAEIPGWFSGEW